MGRGGLRRYRGCCQDTSQEDDRRITGFSKHVYCGHYPSTKDWLGKYGYGLLWAIDEMPVGLQEPMGPRLVHQVSTSPTIWQLVD